jgi:hypothetical protein
MRTTAQLTHLGRFVVAGMALALGALPVQAHDEAPQPAATVSNANATALTASGTVAELIVENQLTGSTSRYLGLRLDDGRTFALSGVGLDALVTGARIDATGTLSGKTLAVAWFTPSTSVQARPAAAKPPKTVDGNLAIYHMDFFDQGRGEYGLAVREASGKITNLNVAAIPDALQPNMQVSIDGTQAADGTSVDVSTITITAAAPAQSGPAGAPITNTVLVIPIRFSDTGADAFNGAAINTEMQTHVATYYQEVSYGQQLLNITVACTTTAPAGCAGRTNANGWLQSTSATPAGCDYTTMGNLADAVAQAAGYDTSVTSTKFVYYVIPSMGCGWAGLAYVGWGHAWSQNVNALWVYGHELGHNFGLWHAGSVGCGAQVLGGSCSASEYGDPFDVMGNLRQMHFNAMQKQVLNWIPGTSVKTHTSGTQTYQLSPIETGGQSTYAVKIPTSNPNRTYWIEYRQPIGFDAPLSGLPNLGAQIRVSSPFEVTSGSDDTEILDMTPGSAAGNGGFDDAALLATAPAYVDSSTGVSIKVNSATAGSAGVLSVTVSMGGKTNTSTTLGSSPNPLAFGASVTFTATVAGSAPTGSVALTDGGAALSGCSAVALPVGAGNTKNATCSTSSLSVGTHNIVASYTGDSGNNASISATLSETVNGPPSSTSVTSSGNPSTVGASVTFTATVAGTAPTATVAFTDGGTAIPGCGAVALPAGTANSKNATCSTSGLTQGTHSIVAAYAGDANNAASSSTVLTQVVNASSSSNVALASAGAVASASSTYSPSASFPASSINNNERAGANWGNGGGWIDGTPNAFPDWVQIVFNGQKTINRVVVYSVQDNFTNPVEPSDTQTFSLFGVTDFTVDGWNGSAWVTLGSVSGNNLVKRTVTFSAFTTDRIRINIINGLNSYSRLTEVEAWGVDAGPPTQINVASASNGGVASASSTYTQPGYSFPATAINNNDRAGINWGYGGGWVDSTANAYPDWVEIDFNGSKTIDHVIVYTIQDNYGSPVEPTDSMTFSLYGITDFSVQGWNGSAWVTLGSVSGNNLVKRTVNFTAFTTTKIRVNVTNALATYSRITEVEAWGN